MGVLDTDPHSLVAVMGAFFRHFYLVSIISGWGAQAEGTLLGGLTCCFWAFTETIHLWGVNSVVSIHRISCTHRRLRFERYPSSALCS